MQSLNNYILEKFKISKNVNLAKFNGDDKVCSLCLYAPSSREINLCIYQPYIFKSIDTEKNKLEYNATNNIGVSCKYYINSHDLYQKQDKAENDSVRTLFLTLEEMNDFLQILVKKDVFDKSYKEYNKADITKILENDYFDSISHFNIISKKLNYVFLSNNGAVREIENKEDLKEIILKFYEKNN